MYVSYWIILFKARNCELLVFKEQADRQEIPPMIYKQVEEKVETSVNLGRDPVQSLILMEGSLFWILIEAYFPKSKLVYYFQCEWKVFSARKGESLYMLL